MIHNLTGNHDINVYPECAFEGLEQVNPTTWVADSVDVSMELACYPECGLSARIATKVASVSVTSLPGEVVTTTYGQLTGLPESVGDGDTLIVSLPTKSMATAAGHPLANLMVSPYKVVRLRSNTSTVLGCMGFTF